jgi:serine/threonine-protein kinase
LGTPPYSSPEQADPRLAGDLDQLASRQSRKTAPHGSAVDVRSDIYSLGVILYELVTGLSPYGVDSPSQVTREMILAQPPVHPREVAAHVDRDLEAILQKALAKDPARRYQVAADLRADVEALLAGQPVRARGERLGYHRRHNTDAKLSHTRTMLRALQKSGINIDRIRSCLGSNFALYS